MGLQYIPEIAFEVEYLAGGRWEVGYNQFARLDTAIKYLLRAFADEHAAAARVRCTKTQAVLFTVTLGA